jgi:hypothetical protein
MEQGIRVVIDPAEPVVTISGQGCSVVLSGAESIRGVRDALTNHLLILAVEVETGCRPVASHVGELVGPDSPIHDEGSEDPPGVSWLPDEEAPLPPSSHRIKGPGGGINV